MNNLKIGKYIKHALSGMEVPVFPVGQDGSNNGESFAPPFVMYRRLAYNEFATKDSIYEDAVNVEIVAVARTYDYMVDMMCTIQQKMHAAPSTWNAKEQKPFKVSDQQLAFGDEEMDDNMTLYVCKCTASIDTD